jgi:hypothetical protein
MTDKVVLGSIASFQNDSTAAAQYNANNATLTTALDNTLSRDGTSPNTMGSILDMNSFQILNLPTPSTGASPLRLQDYNTLLSGGTITVNGVPTGGTTGQILDKNSNTNFDTAWVTNAPAISNVTGLGTGVATFLATPSTANLAAAVTGETGSGALVFGTSPTISAPTISGSPTFSSPLSIANGGTADTGTAYSSFTPSISASTGTFTSVAGSIRYKTIGKTVFLSVVITDTTNGTAAGSVTATLPIAPVANTLYQISGYNNTTGVAVFGSINTSGGAAITISKYDGTFPLASGQSIILSGTYESA